MATTRIPSRWLLSQAQLGLFLAVEAAWLYAWSVALGQWLDPAGSGPLLGLPVVLALALLATGVTRLTLRQSGPPRRLQLGLAGLGLVAAILTGVTILWTSRGAGSWADLVARWSATTLGFRVLGATALAVVVWWRGISAGRSRLTLEDVESGARMATILLAILFLLNALVPPGGGAGVDIFVGATLVVLFAGLVGLPFARVRDLGRSPRHRDQPALAINRHWLGLLLGTVAALLLVTILLALIFTFQRIDELTRPLAGPADALFWLLFYAIALPSGYLVAGLIYLLRLILHPGQARPPPPQPNLGWLDQVRSQAHQGGGPPIFLVLLAKWALIAVVVAVVLLLLARAVFRYADWLSHDDVEEDRDFVLSWSGLVQALRSWLRRLLHQPRWLAPWAPARAVDLVTPDREAREARALYRELLRLGARLGRGRQASETPREYARALDTVPPLRDATDEVGVLTEVYSRARYGPAPPDEIHVARAREALARLRQREADTGAEAHRTRQPPA